MTLHSATFTDGGTLPLSMISTIQSSNGQNSCTASGAAGGNESPQLTWRNAPHETRSFIVIAYDVTAQFTHWMMYNIPADTTSLPENAGTPDSVYGMQNGNDFFEPNYNGPCPPMTLKPFAHVYRFTVCALDRFLPIVPTFGDFTPAGPQGLYQELIEASRSGHVLASASIAGALRVGCGRLNAAGAAMALARGRACYCCRSCGDLPGSSMPATCGCDDLPEWCRSRVL
jgi:Raf kinase inhibitor-like YbhB/YbcL family protein